MSSEHKSPAPLVLELIAVIATVTDEVPRILTVEREGFLLDEAGNLEAQQLGALPSGPLDPSDDRTLELALRAWVKAQTGLDLGYVEQLYTFGNRNRSLCQDPESPRIISVAYLALVSEATPSGSESSRWRDVYACFPWEDWREGRPAVIEESILPALERWIADAPTLAIQRARLERSEVNFGTGHVTWDGDRVLGRYELLYELQLAEEAPRDQLFKGRAPEKNKQQIPIDTLGLPMIMDHRRVFASALGRLRGKIKYRPVVFELLPPTFTLLQLQRLVEALAGGRLHKQNFRRLIERAGLVEGTGLRDTQTGGRPAELFRFRREVLTERQAPGVGRHRVRR